MGDIGKTKRKIEFIPEPKPAEAPVQEPSIAPAKAPEPVPA